MSKLCKAIVNREHNQFIIVEPLMAFPGPVPNMFLCRTPKTTKLLVFSRDMLEPLEGNNEPQINTSANAS